jgi:diguanylate cyclase (GGDEF)-like protein
MIHHEYGQKSRALIQNALRSPFAKIPDGFKHEYYSYQKKLKFKFLFRINVIAQLSYAVYSIIDWYMIADVGLLAITTKCLYSLIAACITFYIYKFGTRAEIFDLVLPISIVGATALWFYLINQSVSPNIPIYIYASLLFIILANISVQIRFTPALYSSSVIALISCIGVYFAVDKYMPLFILYLVIYLPVFCFSLFIGWDSTYKSRSIFLYHKLETFNRQALEVMAHTDVLTGLNNRRYFERLASQAISEAQQNNEETYLLIFDVDHFKTINDTYGHDVGDEVLKKISEVCKKVLRRSDLFARFGGEEFIVLLSNTDKSNVHRIAERLRLQIENSPLHVNGNTPIQFTISIGVTTLGEAQNDLNAAIKQADNALYKAKFSGRNKVIFDEVNVA